MSTAVTRTFGYQAKTKQGASECSFETGRNWRQCNNFSDEQDQAPHMVSQARDTEQYRNGNETKLINKGIQSSALTNETVFLINKNLLYISMLVNRKPSHTLLDSGASLPRKRRLLVCNRHP